ncbi:hypothetical protein BH18ACT2_BH18ACT2_08690 [soil metagenome]
MCFSLQADLIGGVVVSAIGVDALRHVRRAGELPIASLPLLLGGHLLIETFVWWGLDGAMPADAGTAAMWSYLIIAFVVLPPFVPLAVMAIEPSPIRRSLLAAFGLLGGAVGLVLLVTMVREPVTVHAGANHLAYDVGLRDGLLIVILYVVATCGSLLTSSHRHLVVFGLINLPAVVVLAWLNSSGFASLWCAWAAVASVMIAVHLRRAPAGGDTARLLSTTRRIEASPR